MSSIVATACIHSSQYLCQIHSSIRVAEHHSHANHRGSAAEFPFIVSETFAAAAQPFDPTRKNVLFLIGTCNVAMMPHPTYHNTPGGPGSRKGEAVDALCSEYGARLFLQDDVAKLAAEMMQEQHMSTLVGDIVQHPSMS